RHTRCLSDWSSDVCSSDLGDFADLLVGKALVAGLERDLEGERQPIAALETVEQPHPGNSVLVAAAKCPGERLGGEVGRNDKGERSEERRVGKEGRAEGGHG